MCTKNIGNFLFQKEKLISHAEEYMYQLSSNPMRRRIEVEENSDGSYSVNAIMCGKQIEFTIFKNDIYRLAGKSNEEDELEKRIERYIEKKIYKEFLNTKSD